MEQLKHHFKTVFHRSLVLSVFAVIACAKVDFSGPGGSANVNSSGAASYDYTITESSQPIDVLFVIDNSASMYTIQQSIGSKFPSLFSTLKQYDYHLAITTTDIADATNVARSINQNGALQNGKLIPFADGSYYLTQSSTNPQTLFAAAIARPETLACTNYVMNTCGGNCTDPVAYAQFCPSEDTRGIYAANMTLQGANFSAAQQGFSRANVPMAVVIISNSDERATGGQYPGIALVTNDQPSSLRTEAASLNKSLTVYPIIIVPNDSSCLAQQHLTSTLYGWYGNIYSQMGSASSICSTDFSANLTTIGNGIAQQMTSVTLNCVPQSNSVTVIDSTGTKQTLTSSGTTLVLPHPLTGGQSLELQYTCSN